jgi:hypothetical protein
MDAGDDLLHFHAFMKYGAIHWGPGNLTEEQLKFCNGFESFFNPTQDFSICKSGRAGKRRKDQRHWKE